MSPEKKDSFHFPAAGLIALFVIGLWGCLLIYATHAMSSSPGFYAWRQMIWLAAGCLGFAVFAAVPFPALMRCRDTLFRIALTALILVLIFGKRVHGMAGWFTLPGSIFLQPSEFAKPVFLLMLAGIAADRSRTEKQRFLQQILVAGIVCLLILAEPDFGSTVLFYLGLLIVLWLQGTPPRFLIPAVLAAPVGASLFLYWKPYAFDRILSYLNPGSTAYRGTWHIRQFQYALAEGGWTGSEHGAALWSNAYLPLPHSDSLFASIVETSGLMGGLIVLLAFSAASFGMVLLTKRERLIPEAALYVEAAAFLYLTQALIHISVNVVLLPPTGVTLPLLSYGGSSLCSTMIALGTAFSAFRSGRIKENGSPSGEPEKLP